MFVDILPKNHLKQTKIKNPKMMNLLTQIKKLTSYQKN